MEDEYSESGKRRRRERYVRKACAACKRRKIKCDGEQPCLHCQTVNAACEYFEGKARGGARRPLKPAEPQEEYADDVLSRLHAVETRLDAFAAQYPLTRRNSMDSMQQEHSGKMNGNSRLPSSASLMTDVAHSSAWSSQGPTSIPGVASSTQKTLLTSLPAPVPSSVFYGQSSSAGNLSNLRNQLHSFAQVENMNGDMKAEPAAPTSRQGQTPQPGTADLPLPQFSLPSKSRTFAILHAMFDDLMSMYPLLHSPTFYRRYESLWDHNGVFSQHFAQTRFSRSEIGLLLACMAACSNMTARVGQMDSREISLETQQWWAAAKILIYDRALDNPTCLESIQGKIMLGLYYLHSENEDAAYKLIGLAIRSAYEIGLHLASRERDLSVLDVELRRRTWWCLYLVDRRTSMQLGRPFSVQDYDSNVLYPTPLDDLHEFPQQMDAPIRLETSKIPYLMHFVRFSSICGEIYSKLYGVKCRWPPDERIVMDLDAKLEQWRFGLPPFLRFDQTNINTIPPWLAKQQLFLHLRGAHVRLLLLRPFVSEPDAIAQSHPAMAESALHLSSDIIHTISIIKRTSDLVERLWYPSKQIILTCIGIIFWVVLNFPNKFSASSSKADLRVALHLLKDFSERSTSPRSGSSLRDIQFLRYLCNQALKARNQRPLESAAQSPYHEPNYDAPAMGDTFIYEGQGDLAFLGGTPDMGQDNLLLGLLETGDPGILPTSEQFLMMGEDYSRQNMLSL